MKPIFSAWTRVALALAVPCLLLAAPAAAQGGRGGGGGSHGGGGAHSGGGGHAAPAPAPSSGGSGGAGASQGSTSSGGSSQGSGSGGGASSGAGSHAGTGGHGAGGAVAVSRGGSSTGNAGTRMSGGHGGVVERGVGRGVERGPGGSRESGSENGSSGAAATAPGGHTNGRGTGAGEHAVIGSAAGTNGRSDPGHPDSSAAVPPFSRPRDGKPIVGHAVPRTAPPVTGGGGTIIPGFFGGYFPLGYGGLGIGSYYGGYYDPYDPYDPYGGGYDPGQYTQPSSHDDEGALRLKIKPRGASVYVDGYYSGVVDDFDGIFQKLHIDAGAHRIEIRAPGYETLAFDVRIEADRTTTYHGELTKLP